MEQTTTTIFERTEIELEAELSDIALSETVSCQALVSRALCARDTVCFSLSSV